MLTREWNLIRPSVCHYIKDNRPLNIFDVNDHCVQKIQALTYKGPLGSNLNITKIF